MFNWSSTVSKCIEIFVWMMWQGNFILLRKPNENVVEKSLAGLLSYTRILNESKKVSFFMAVAMRLEIVFRNKRLSVYFIKNNRAHRQRQFYIATNYSTNSRMFLI